MLFDEASLRNDLEKVVNSLKEDMKDIRTGRPSIDFFDKVMVDYYGTKTQLTYMAQIAFDSAMSMTIRIHDKNASNEVKKALDEANIGASINEAEKGIFKLNFQPLTEEDRVQKVKDLGKLLEEKKIRARQVRQEYMEGVKNLEKVSEDDQKRSEEAIQKIIDEYIDKLDQASSEKQSELMII